jgi:glycosidase
VLPDFSTEDNVGSPYCVKRYVVDPQLGGPKGLAIARRELASRGLRLVLDFVPNHVAPDHSWVSEHPEYFITGTDEDLKSNPASYLRLGGVVFACGRDPYFPAWPDVLQLNAFNPGLRHAAINTLTGIADQCDGIRCDMAMLLLNSIFERTWEGRSGPRPPTEYWDDVISTVKQSHPPLILIAEAYWDLEWELQQQGFSFCYDKRLYDRLQEGTAESIRLHLAGNLSYQQKLLHFIENHDEPRAAATFSPARERAAAVVMATVAGARLFHEGQFEGRKQRISVFLRRRPQEPVNHELREFYEKLLKSLGDLAFHDGEWTLCPCSGWPDNQSFKNLLAWTWQQDEDRHLIVINFSGSTAQGRIQVPWSDRRGGVWRLSDTLSQASYDREGAEMSNPGLYVELGPWSFNSFSAEIAVVPKLRQSPPQTAA